MGNGLPVKKIKMKPKLYQPKSQHQSQYKRNSYEKGQPIQTDTMYKTQRLEDQPKSSMSQERNEAFTYLNIRYRNKSGIYRLCIKLDMGAQGNTINPYIPQNVTRKIRSIGFPN